MSCLTVNIGGGFKSVRGSGNVITETRQVSGFERVSLSGVGELTLTQADQESLEVDAEDNLIPYIKTEVRGNTLYIEIDPDRVTIRPTKPILYRLAMKEIRGIDVSGAGSVQAGDIQTDNLDVDSSGVGKVELGMLQADKLAVSISGAGGLEVAGGKVERLKIEISGAGAYKAPDLQSQVADILISGAGNAKLWVADSLDVMLSGAGSIEYYGQPSVTQEVSGVGGVKSLGEHP
jgi:hypothetical protein